ncbi:hypothetical protein CDAR_38291 [Caerostris darwini]|uniref:Ribosomal protein L20 n=1 Tax=Caerostris darwini TaxID=1538125 RepID=A0AAV4V396_9ARAC|nr:hypothetical protein CDAR_38291 [Caerostris darwini]
MALDDSKLQKSKLKAEALNRRSSIKTLHGSNISFSLRSLSSKSNERYLTVERVYYRNSSFAWKAIQLSHIKTKLTSTRGSGSLYALVVTTFINE